MLTRTSSCAAEALTLNARYVPNYDASWQTLLSLAAESHVGRAVILQPSFLGFDNSYLFEALRARPAQFRGVPWISPSVELSAASWDEDGAHWRAWAALPDLWPAPDPSWPAYAAMLAEALRRDWPIHLYVEGRRLPGLLPLLLDAGHKVVIPHFGMFDRTLVPLRDPGFELLLQKADTSGCIWVVFSGAYRVGYERARAAAPLLFKAYGPDRLMWGQRLAAHRHRPQPRHDVSRDAAMVQGPRPVTPRSRRSPEDFLVDTPLIGAVRVLRPRPSIVGRA